MTIVIRRLPEGRGFQVRVAPLGEIGTLATALRPQIVDVRKDLERLGIPPGIADHTVRHLSVGDECILEEMVVERNRLRAFAPPIEK